MNCYYWGSNKHPMTLFFLHSTTTKRHRVTAALASGTYQGHTGVLLSGFYPSKVHPRASLLFFQQIPVLSQLPELQGYHFPLSTLGDSQLMSPQSS